MLSKRRHHIAMDVTTPSKLGPRLYCLSSRKRPFTAEAAGHRQAFAQCLLSFRWYRLHCAIVFFKNKRLLAFQFLSSMQQHTYVRAFYLNEKKHHTTKQKMCHHTSWPCVTRGQDKTGTPGELSAVTISYVLHLFRCVNLYVKVSKNTS